MRPPAQQRRRHQHLPPAAGGRRAARPVSASTPAPPGQAALSAADADGLVSAGAIASAPVSGITLAFTPASATGASAAASLQVGAATALGVYQVQVQFSNNDAVPQTAGCTVRVSVVPPPVAARIREIQGAAHLSPLEGQRVLNVTGIVTARRANGFYMQDPQPDNDPATSEGIFVFTSSAPAVNVGDALSVAGTVSEFRAGGSGGLNNLTITEIVSPAVTLLSSGNPLPEPVLVGAAAGFRRAARSAPGSCLERNVENASATCTFDPARDGIDFWESLEGMRVTLRNAIATGPTNGFGEISVVADLGANAGPRTARGGVRVSPGDFNPERVFLDDGFLPMPVVNVGDSFPQVTGIVDYTFANFKLQVTEPFTVSSGGLAPEVTRAQAPNQLAIASFNVENLAPSNPPEKFAALAAQIVQNLRSPDVIALMEVQDNSGSINDGTVDASLTFNLLAMAIEAAGGPAYQFRSIDPVNNQDGGEPGGNIRVGFFFNPARVAFVDRPGGGPTTATTVVAGPGGAQLSASPGRLDPSNVAFNANAEAGTFPSRKPLAGEFVFKGHRLFMIANHFNSKGGDEPLFGRFQPPALVTEAQRLRQATVVRDFVRSIFALDSHAKVVVLGDLNDFEFSPPLALLKTCRCTTWSSIAARRALHLRVRGQLAGARPHPGEREPGAPRGVRHRARQLGVRGADQRPRARGGAPVPAAGHRRGHPPGEGESSKLRFDRATGQYHGTITVTNSGREPIAGPLQIVLDRLEHGVTLVNAAGTHRGDPYLTSAGRAGAARLGRRAGALRGRSSKPRTDGPDRERT